MLCMVARRAKFRDFSCSARPQAAKFGLRLMRRGVFAQSARYLQHAKTAQKPQVLREAAKRRGLRKTVLHDRTDFIFALDLLSRVAGIVTLASFTCQWRDALMGRTQRNQWLAEFESGAGHLENPLFLADVTMPSARLLHHESPSSGISLLILRPNFRDS